MCNLVKFHEINWSEAFCFGLGAGLGFWLFNHPGHSPGCFIHVRSADLENQFFRRIGLPEVHRSFESPLKGELGLCEPLRKGLPVLVQTDIYYLPYYKTKTHFPGHAVTVWGFDETEHCFFVTDTERKEEIKVSFSDMSRARFCKGLFIELKGDLYCPEAISVPEKLDLICRDAITANSRLLMDHTIESQGIEAIRRWSDEIAEWKHLPDWQWASRFCYQVIERRGTGGGGFRLLYAEFLSEASSFLPEIESAGLPRLMNEIGLAWQELAYKLKDISENRRADFSGARKLIDTVYSKELFYHQKALELYR